MNKSILFGISVVFLAVLLLGIASAAPYNVYSNHEPYFSYHYDSLNDVAGVCYSFNDRGCNHDYPKYRYRSLGSWNFDSDDDREFEYKKRKAGRWVGKSFSERYDAASGKTSGEFFGGADKAAQSSTNFRYKETYDLRDGGGNGRDYYYKPEYDSEQGYYNWRY